MTALERSPCGTTWVCNSIFSIRPSASSFADDHLARGEAEHAVELENRRLELRARLDAAREVRVGVEQEIAFGSHDADHGKAVTLAHLEIVEVVRGRYLDGARALLGVRIFVGDDRNAPADQRQDHVLADEMFVALIVGVHGDGAVAEHGLGPRGGDDDVGAVAAFDRIAEMPEMPFGLDRLDFEVGDGGQQIGVPIDEPLVLVDERRRGKARRRPCARRARAPRPW